MAKKRGIARLNKTATEAAVTEQWKSVVNLFYEGIE